MSGAKSPYRTSAEQHSATLPLTDSERYVPSCTHVWLRAYASGAVHLVSIGPNRQVAACGFSRPLYWTSFYPSGIKRCLACQEIAS